jgi:hypothetical protein
MKTPSNPASNNMKMLSVLPGLLAEFSGWVTSLSFSKSSDQLANPKNRDRKSGVS